MDLDDTEERDVEDDRRRPLFIFFLGGPLKWKKAMTSCKFLGGEGGLQNSKKKFPEGDECQYLIRKEGRKEGRKDRYLRISINFRPFPDTNCS